jgi:hypothetical protein
MVLLLIQRGNVYLLGASTKISQIVPNQWFQNCGLPTAVDAHDVVQSLRRSIRSGWIFYQILLG